MLVLHASLQEGPFVFDFLDQLFIVDLVERVSGNLLRPVREHTLEFILVVLADVLALFKLACDLQQLLNKFGLTDFELANPNLATNFEQLHNVAGVSLNSFNAHVVVHSLFHESGVGKCFALFRDNHGVETNQTRQVEEHVRLVVTQTADRVFSVVWI